MKIRIFFLVFIVSIFNACEPEDQDGLKGNGEILEIIYSDPLNC